MPEPAEKLTPMLEQYRAIKKDYTDALLFFRMGDFYELFFEDAITASRELQLTLTSRGKSGANSAPMCGVPWHAVQSYLAQLIDRGYNVAICEQMEDPAQAKGLVARAVTQVITPGTVLDESALEAKAHNYLGAVFCGMNNACAMAWADISTGQWTGLEFRRQADLWQWVKKISPAELLLVDGQQLPGGFAQEGMRIAHQPAINFELKRASERILAAQGVAELATLGLESKPALARACGALLAYLDQTQKRAPDQLLPFKPLDLGRRMLIDELTERNLEIFRRLDGRKGKGSLIHVLDDTITPMGGRFLRDMLRNPWKDVKTIQRIQACVTFLHDNDDLRNRLRAALAAILDLERLLMRAGMGRFQAKDFFGIRQSIDALEKVRACFDGLPPGALPEALSRALNSLDTLEDCSALLATALVDNFQAVEGDYGIFRQGYNADLDEQLDLLTHGEEKLREYLQKEQEKTGLSRLKLGYNRVFGYFLEITRNNLGNEVPTHFARRQSLSNVERFTTDELKNLEQNLSDAQEKRRRLESAMFEDLRLYIAQRKERAIQSADVVAQLDYWQSLAETGRRFNWIMPEVNDSADIHIIEGRHPVIEAIIGSSNFVANDFHLDASRRLCLLTGPNMAGKSTILRQVALICLLAQIGGMVPANKASIGAVDRLFSRVGASDNLAQGQSTFMVEMMETARILRQASKRSLVILDEIGRGTSTYDGMSIAWAVVEDLAIRCQGQLRTIFATHYHELTALEGEIRGLFTMNIAVGDYGAGEILFLHKLLPGPSDKSYGVEVARLAGVPYPVVQRARDILAGLERRTATASGQNLELPGIGSRKKIDATLLTKELAALNLDATSPVMALTLLKEWQKKYCGSNGL